MTKEKEILSDLVVFSKYAKYIPELKRRETWDEIVNRYEGMMTRKYPSLSEEIKANALFIRQKKVLPSMRALQFAGLAAEVNNARVYNCCYLPVDSIDSFGETMFLLLGGTGVGYSVQKHHVEQLPVITKPTKTRRYLINDSIIGWADAVKVLMKGYLEGKTLPDFDFRDIRPKGARLITAGGKAPGPEPLKECLFEIQKILDRKEDGDRLTPVECHDILCYIANSVLAGGIRRAAMIALFSLDDEEMLTCKYGNWWELNEQRGRANNSAVLERDSVSEKEFKDLWKKIELSNSGEPGFYFTNNKDWGTNPCCFTGDMEILTPNGYRKIGTIVGEGELLNKDGKICNSLIWSNGVKSVIQLTLSNKKKIRCTPEHRLMLANKSEREAKDTKGERIRPYYTLNEEVSEYTKYGFIQGDGGTGRLSSDSHKGLEVNIGDKDGDIFELFGIEKEKDKVSYYLNGYNEILKTLKFDSRSLPERALPKEFIMWSRQDQLMFFKGLYSANGSIIANSRIAFKTTSKQLAKEVQEFLSFFSISSYVTTNREKEVEFSNGNYTCKESYDINITTLEGVLTFASKIGFVHQYKKDALIALIDAKSPKVISIKDAGEEEVFDFSLEDETHWGVVEGIIAHNCEIGLRPYQFCNLCEVNASDIVDQKDLDSRVMVAAFFGTLQAGFTDFHYLRPIWEKTTKKDALIGIGMTGIASGTVLNLDLTSAAATVERVNKMVAQKIGINAAARQTCVKPSGTTSLVLGSSSGIHAWHDKYFIRTVRFNKNEDIASYLIVNHPELVEDDALRPKTAICARIPMKAPETGILRSETAIDLLERVKKFSTEWIKPGHIDGDNTHNVSATISIDKDRMYTWRTEVPQRHAGYLDSQVNEWEMVGNWMWHNRDIYNGLSVLPADNGSYTQAPFETCTEEQYDKRMESLTSIDLTKVIEEDDTVNFGQVAACAGGACEVNV